MARPDNPQPFSLAEAIIPVASLILLVAMSYYLFGDAGASGPNQIGLVIATMIGVFLAWRRGHSLDSLREAAIASVGSGIGAVFILLAVGALIGTWALSGTPSPQDPSRPAGAVHDFPRRVQVALVPSGTESEPPDPQESFG